MQPEDDDPLKSLDKIMEPDERQANFVASLADTHAELSELTLHAGVPAAVRQVFETAKNVSLYSWFVYRFHQVAELVAYTALEFALRSRAGHAEFGGIDKKHLPGPSQLLKRAQSAGWLKSKAFPSLGDMALRRARHAVMVQSIQLMGERDEIPVREPTQDEIAKAAAEIDVPQIFAKTVPQLRNALAHGSSMLHPNSRSTLRLIGEAINQLFPVPQEPECGASGVASSEQ